MEVFHVRSSVVEDMIQRRLEEWSLVVEISEGLQRRMGAPGGPLRGALSLAIACDPEAWMAGLPEARRCGQRRQIDMEYNNYD